MRTVVGKNEVAHFWANQTQSCAYTPRRDFSFDGRHINSYRARIATLVPDAQCVLYNWRYIGFSKTTNEHFSIVRRAVDRNRYPNAFEVPETNVPVHKRGGELHHDHVVNVKHFIQRHADRLVAADQPRIRQNTREAAQEQARYWIRQADAYCKLFKLPRAVTRLLDQKALANAHALLAADRERAAAEVKRRMAAAEAANVERLRVNGLTPEQALAEWREGKIGSYPCSGYPDMRLRIRADKVETSRGANIPVEHAKRVWPILLRAKRNGTHITAEQGGGLHFGVYQSFHEFNAEGSGALVVGCHSIPFEELEYVAQQLGLSSTQEGLNHGTV